MSFISFRIGNFVPCIAVKKIFFFLFVNYIPYSSVFLGTNFNISIEQTTVVICVGTCDVFLCKKQTKALPSVFVNHIIKMLRIKKKSLIIFVHGVTNVPFGLEDI